MPGTTIPETGNYIHVTVPDWAKSDEEGTVRTISISQSDGILGLYNVEKKKVFTFLFDKQKWSKSSAEKWVSDHEKRKSESLMLDLDSMVETINLLNKQTISESLKD